MLSRLIQGALARRGWELWRRSPEAAHADLEARRPLALLDEVKANLATTGYPSDQAC